MRRSLDAGGKAKRVSRATARRRRPRRRLTPASPARAAAVPPSPVRLADLAAQAGHPRREDGQEGLPRMDARQLVAAVARARGPQAASDGGLEAELAEDVDRARVVVLGLAVGIGEGAHGHPRALADEAHGGLDLGEE